ncbi:MAG TPA: DUF1707 domain-containing protein [Acidimicrobiales bacterium]|nr:DUF1707 domain-containing protein [Acidimicrobiales bacterium]
MRISDTERQRTIDELRRHCAAGRIDVDEYAHRIETVMGASTLEDLDAVLHDLPMLRIADPSMPGERSGSGSLFEPRGLAPGEEAGGGRRLAAAVTVLLTVAIVITAAVLLAVVSWGWALVLLGGWTTGLVQGVVLRRRRRA